VFCKTISEIFYLFFFIPGFLAKFHVFCKKDFVNFDPFPFFLGLRTKLSKEIPSIDSFNLGHDK